MENKEKKIGKLFRVNSQKFRGFEHTGSNSLAAGTLAPIFEKVLKCIYGIHSFRILRKRKQLTPLKKMATSLGYVLMNWTSTFNKKKRHQKRTKNVTTKDSKCCQTNGKSSNLLCIFPPLSSLIAFRCRMFFVWRKIWKSAIFDCQSSWSGKIWRRNPSQIKCR